MSSDTQVLVCRRVSGDKVRGASDDTSQRKRRHWCINFDVSDLRKMNWSKNIEGSDLAKIEQKVNEVSVEYGEVTHMLREPVARFLLGLKMQSKQRIRVN